jgi:hypothetical protein
MTLTAAPVARPIWYLGSPYSRYPGGREAAFKIVAKKAGELMRAGYAIFCPIAHSHPIELEAATESTHDFWLGQDIAFLAVCEGMFVYQMPSWEISFGLGWEIEHMKQLGKPIFYLPWEGEP